MKPNATGTNRNGANGDYAEFAPEKLSREQLIARIRNLANPPERTSRDLLDVDGFSLVRYRLGSDELRGDCHAVGIEDLVTYPTFHDCTAIFGVIDRRRDRAVAIVQGDDERGPEISYAFKTRDADLPNGVMAAVLNHLDVPATWRTGADTEIARTFDLWNVEGTGQWALKAPMAVVVVTFERMCFYADPVLRETADVFMPAEDGRNIADSDENKAYWAKDY